MSINNISNTSFPNTLNGLESISATSITINGVDISTLYVPFINSPNDVDLGTKDLVTTGKLQSTLLKLPSLTNSTSKYLQLNSDKEVISTDLGLVYVPYTGATANLDMGAFAVKSSYIPVANEDMINKRYADITLLTQSDASSTYLSQANAAIIYVPYNGATGDVNIGSYAFRTYFVPIAPNDIVNKNFVDTTFLSQTNAASTYLSQANAAILYLTQTDAASTYLSQANAAIIYLTQSDAATIYATITNLALKANIASPTFTGTVSGITSAMVGLGNVDNTSDANKPVSTATQTALNLKADLASPTFTGTVSGITKAMVGLSNVDNTSDANKPVSTATQTALNLKADLASPTFTGIPLSTTASPGTNTTQIATTAFVTAAVGGTGVSSFSAGSTGFTPNTATTGAVVLAGTLNVANGGTGVTSSTGSTSVVLSASPTLTGVPLAPTASPGTNTTQIATTAFVTAAVGGAGVSSFSGGTTGLLPNTATTGAVVLSGTLNVANGGTGVTSSTGSTSLVLSASPTLTGVPLSTTAAPGTNTTQIATTAFVTTAVSAVGIPTQINPTPTNTGTLYPVFLTSTAGGASTTYVESDGSMNYDPLNNILTLPTLRATGLVQSPSYSNGSGQTVTINASGGMISGNQVIIQMQGTTYYWFDQNAFYLTQPINNTISSILNDLYLLVPSGKIISLNNWVSIDNAGLFMTGLRPVVTQNIATQPTTDLNINVPTSSNLCNFQINGSTVLSVNSTGLRPATDTLSLVYSSMPTLKFTDGTNNMTIVSYVGGAEFRYAGTTRLGFDATGMYVNNIRNISGVNLDINGNGAGIVNLQSYGNNVFQTNATGARVTASTGSLVFSNTANIQTDSDGFNWYIGGASQVGYFDKNAWAPGYGWRIHSNAFATYECAYDMTIQCKTGGVPQYQANNRMINIITPNSINSPNDIGGWGWYTGATVFRSENGGNQGDGIGISMSSSGTYGGNNWGYVTCVNPGVAWRNWAFSGAVGYWYVNGTACAYINSTAGWQAASDERCKRDIQDLNTKKSLQRVLKCKPKHYKRILNKPKGENPIPLKQEDINRVHIGLLAQEVLEYNPHCVSTWEDDTEDGKKVERLGLAYQDFIIHLIGSVQEQQKQIDAQQIKIEEQSIAINTLSDSVKTLTEHLTKLTNMFNENTKK